MTRYHINPHSGNPNLCKAQEGNCPFGSADQHYESKSEARSAYSMRRDSFPSLSRFEKARLPLVKPGDPNPLLAEASVKHKKNHGGEDFRGRDGGRYLFLSVRGVNVAAVKIYEREDGPHLCDVETRPAYRRQGYGKKILEEVAKLYGVPKIIHGSGFTPDGYNFISAHVERPEIDGPAQIDFPEYDETNPFEVIHDWDKEQTKFDG